MSSLGIRGALRSCIVSTATRCTGEGHGCKQSSQQGTFLAEEPILLRISGEGCASLDGASEIGIQLSQVFGKSLVVILHVVPPSFAFRPIDTYPSSSY